ncbi:MAG: hypothetical protein ING64_02265 [Rhodocyclaceae bacterium]|nr:hypothetical protein [Rhodocyclaceae bacterium]
MWPPTASVAKRIEFAQQSSRQACASKGAAVTQLSPQVLKTHCTCSAERAVV